MSQKQQRRKRQLDREAERRAINKSADALARMRKLRFRKRLVLAWAILFGKKG